MATQVVAEKIIRVDVVTSAAAQRNIKILADEVAKVEKNTSVMQGSLEKGFGGLASAASRVAGVLSVIGVGTTFGAIAKQVLEAASSYQVLESRLKNVLGTQEKANVATKDVIDIAVKTGREVDGVAKLYEKASRSAQQFGISQDAVKQITTGFAESIRLSGASTQEAYASLVQFGQALASGRLQGDEFRSLMENNAVFMYEFAKAAGVSVAQLRKMGTEGKLNAQFLFETMLKKGADGLNMLQRLENQARSMPLTFAQSLNSLGTQTTAAIGELSKALTFTSSDSLGLFGPITRSLQRLTQSIKEAREESEALGEGFFARLKRLLSIPTDKSTLDNLPFGVGAASRLFNKSDPADTGEVGRLKRISDAAAKLQTQLDATDAAIVRLEGKGQLGPDDTDRLKRLKTRAEELTNSLNRTKALTESIENFDNGSVSRQAGAGPIKKDNTLSEEEQKRLKRAGEAFRDYVQNLKQARDAEVALADGKTVNIKAAKEEQEILEKAREAGIKETDTRVRYAIALAKETQIRKDRREEVEKFETLRKKEIEAEATQDAKIQQSIERDTAAIEALKNRTRVTQEYTTAVMKKNLEDAQTLLLFAEDKDSEATERLKARIAALQLAIDKRNELENAQGDRRRFELQEKIDEQNKKEADKLADSITNSLKNGLGNRNVDIGTQLWENIQNTFRSKVIDIVFNPILDPISQALSRIALKFAEEMATQIALSIANQSSDPLGTFIDLIGATTAPTGAVGIERVPYDGFVAKLHRGERVQTANEAENYRKDRAAGGGWGGGVSVAPTYMINIDSRTDAATISNEVQQAVQQGNQQLVEELRSRGMIR